MIKEEHLGGEKETPIVESLKLKPGRRLLAVWGGRLAAHLAFGAPRASGRRDAPAGTQLPLPERGVASPSHILIDGALPVP